MAILSKTIVPFVALFGSATGTTLSSTYSTSVSSFTGTPTGTPAAYQMLVFAKNYCTIANTACYNSPIMTNVGSSLSSVGLTSTSATALQTSADLVFQKAALLAGYSTTPTTNFDYDLGNTICSVFATSAADNTGTSVTSGSFFNANSAFSGLFGRTSVPVSTAISAVDATIWARVMSQLGSNVDTTNVKPTGLSVIPLAIIKILTTALTASQNLVLGGMVSPLYTGDSVLTQNLLALNTTAIGIPSFPAADVNAAGAVVKGLTCEPSSDNGGAVCTTNSPSASSAAVGGAINTAKSMSARGSSFLVGYLGTSLQTTGGTMDALTIARLFSSSWGSPVQALDLAYSLQKIGDVFTGTYNQNKMKNAQAAMMWMFTNSTYVFPVSA